ncbi:MAG TPA: FAD-dependent oxidoreductase, partial [Caulobacteraceae bacterium]|nr:FAD-dependent oxidoreductase [Caulobacteraceae bacterium]
MEHAHLAHDRRRLLRGGLAFGGLAGLAACATGPAAVVTPASPAPGVRTIHLAPIRASAGRIFDVTVCLRPFRAAGPRIEAEQVGNALVVHNYGHGGSGWSLSWGSAAVAVRLAMARSPAQIAVVGCGALGLTTALVAQRAGAKVTIYTRDLLPETRSARATGSWTPDSRIALAGKAAPGFGDLWEEMARTSFKEFRSYLGLPGSPVEWTERYLVPGGPHRGRRPPGALQFAGYGDRIRDITPPWEDLAPGATPFGPMVVSRTSQMRFNIADYGHILMTDFLLAGGQVERREFHAPAEIAALPQKVVINCPGYGARALWMDDSIVPVRGQIAWLIPQDDVSYGVIWDGV